MVTYVYNNILLNTAKVIYNCVNIQESPYHYINQRKPGTKWPSSSEFISFHFLEMKAKLLCQTEYQL